MKYWVVGSPDAVLGFGLVGIGGHAVGSEGEAEAALDEAVRMPDAGVVLVTKDVAQIVRGKLDQLKLHSPVPLVLEIPGPEGVAPGEPTLGELVLRAIGIRL